MAFAPDGKVLVSSLSLNLQSASRGRNKTGPDQSLLHLWDVGTGRAIRRIGLGESMIGEMALAPDGKTVAVGMVGQRTGDDEPMVVWGDRSVRLHELPTGREIRRFGRDDVAPDELAFSPDGTMLASGNLANPSGAGDDTPVRTTALQLWDVATGRESRRWEARASGTMCLAFAPGGQTLAWVASQEHIIRFWDVAAIVGRRPTGLKLTGLSADDADDADNGK
jgi:WD40 repeat protein